MKHYAGVGCVVGLALVAVIPACAGDEISTVGDGTSQSAGGAASSGGSATTGGVATDGAGGLGGATGTGGSLSTVGEPSSGGMVATGGADATGGANATGGADAIGGANATGGANAIGGANATGGADAMGGANATGGEASSQGGGTAGVGGGDSTAGGTNNAETGGNSSNNVSGATSTGGVSSFGGSSGAGGGGKGSGGKATGGSISTGGAPTTGGTSSTGTSRGCGSSNVPAACSSTMTGTCSLTINGKKRTYYVVLPANYDPNRAYPVVTAWHYSSGTAEALLPSMFSTVYSGFYGIRPGFPNAIYVTAQGLPSTTGGIDYGWANIGGQDIAFARAILDWLNSNFCVDTTRIFSAGFSYGAIMSATLGCQMADTYRAVGVMSGSDFSSSGCVNHPVAAWLTYGDADTAAVFTSGLAARDLFIKQNGCSTTNTQSVAVNGATCTQYNDCTSGNNPVVWCPVSGGGHAIPSFAAAEITKFFQQF